MFSHHREAFNAFYLLGVLYTYICIGVSIYTYTYAEDIKGQIITPYYIKIQLFHQLNLILSYTTSFRQPFKS